MASHVNMNLSVRKYEQMCLYTMKSSVSSNQFLASQEITTFTEYASILDTIRSVQVFNTVYQDDWDVV